MFLPLRNIAIPAPRPNKPAPAPKYGLSDSPAISSVIGMVKAFDSRKLFK